MSDLQNRAEKILKSLDHAGDVPALLDKACGGNNELRQQVQVLLDLHNRTGNILTPLPLEATMDQSGTPDPGRDGTTMPMLIPSAQASGFVGPYKLLQQIGEGGMGTVWMAEQEKPVRRRVALKLIRADIGSKEIVARFEAERQALAMMGHPNIARVLDAGTTEAGTPYFVMELVKGIPLNQYCDQNKLSIADRLEIFIPICNAVQHAHQKGILHRDLKPSNVLVTTQDGKPLPKVIDFGLAKAVEHTQKLTDKTLFTEFGKVVGTLQYMSPEQAEMSVLDVDTRTDIYSLGVMLYELLTGSTPLEKESLTKNALLQVLTIIRETEPPLPSARLSSSGDAVTVISEQRKITPSRLQQILKGDLDWVVMKAIEKERPRRYETANGFAMDIRRFLDGEPVLAVPPSNIYKIRKFVQRNRIAVTAAALVLLALTAGIAGTTWGLIEARRQQGNAQFAAAEKETARKLATDRAEGERLAKIEAERQQGLAEETAASLRIEKLLKSENLYVADMNLIQQAWQSGLPDRVRSLLDRHIPENGSADLRTFEWYYFDSLYRNADSAPEINYGEKITCVAVDPSSELVALAGDDGNIQIWNIVDPIRKVFDLVGDTSASKLVQFSPDGQFLLSSDRESVWIWKKQADGFVVIHKVDSRYATLSCISPDGNLVVVPVGNSIELFDIRSLKTERLEGHSKQVTNLCFTHSGQEIVSSSADGLIRRWDVASGNSVGTPVTISAPVDAFEISDDDKLIAFSSERQLSVASLDDEGTNQVLTKLTGNPRQLVSLNNGRTFAVELSGEISFWEFGTGEFVGRLIDPVQFKNGMSVSPTGSRFATSGSESLVHIWDSANLERIRTIRGHTNTIYRSAFLKNGGLITASRDHTARIWSSLQSPNSMRLHDGNTRLWSLSFSKDSRLLATAGEDSRVVVWDVATGARLCEIVDPERSVQFVRFSPDGRILASAGKDGVIRLWNIQEKKTIAEMEGHSDVINSLDFSNDGSLLVSGGNSGIVIVWDIESKSIRSRIKTGDAKDVWAVGFAKTGNAVVFGGMNQRINIWEFESGTGPVLFHQLRENLTSLDFSMDGKWLSATSSDGALMVFDYLNREVRYPLIAHSGDAMFAAFSPDANTLVSGGSDGGSIQFWNMKTGEPTFSLEGDGVHIHSVAFSPNGKVVAVARWDGTVRMWKAE